MLVQMGAVEITEPGFVFGKMGRDPIDYHSDLTLMEAIHQIHKIRGSPKPASGGIIANYFIPPGTIERVLHDGEELDVCIARIMNVIGELHGHFPVGE